MRSVFTKAFVATAVFVSAAANATVISGTGDPLSDPILAGGTQINFDPPAGPFLPFSISGVNFTAVNTAPVVVGGYFATEGAAFGYIPVVTFTFDQPVNAVAFDVLSFGPALWTFSIFSNGELLDSVVLNPSTFSQGEYIGNGQFSLGDYIGLSGTGITSATLARNSNQVSDNILIDNFTYSVPEPSTWAMMLLGFGAMGWQLRRRRSSHAVRRTNFDGSFHVALARSFSVHTKGGEQGVSKCDS